MTNNLDLGPLREQIVEALKGGVCEVTFNKVSGEHRVMPCTLKEDLLPTPTKETTAQSLRGKESDVISVWCTDANGWRSFKLSNFISINPLYEQRHKELDSNT